MNQSTDSVSSIASSDLDDFNGSLNMTDSDTEDASETDYVSNQLPTNVAIKEQLYMDKMADLLKQMQQLDDKSHPEYLKRIKQVVDHHKYRMDLNSVYLRLETEYINKEYNNEKEAAIKQYKEKKAALKDNLIAQLEEQKKNIQHDWESLDIVYDKSMGRLVPTRKLRGRKNDLPMMSLETVKKSKPIKTNIDIDFMLDESQIEEDLKKINKSIYGDKMDA